MGIIAPESGGANSNSSLATGLGVACPKATRIHTERRFLINIAALGRVCFRAVKKSAKLWASSDARKNLITCPTSVKGLLPPF